jgi:hypothetical protein
VELEEPKPRLTIVTAQNRHLELAYLAQALGMTVTVIDFSKIFADSLPENIEGPFPVDVSILKAHPIFNKFFNHADLRDLELGPVVMTPKGPLRFISGLSNPNVIDPSRWGFDQGSAFAQLRWYLNRNQNFDKLNPKKNHENERNFLAPHVMRWRNHRHLTLDQQEIERVGIKFLANPQKVLSFKRTHSTQELTVGPNDVELIQSELVLWGLTSEETFFMNPELMPQLYPKGVLAPELGWVRARVSVTEKENLNTFLPLFSIWIADEELPWLAKNFFVLRATSAQNVYDVWYLVNSGHRFLPSYLLSPLHDIVEILKSRVSSLQWQIIENPVESIKSAAEIGPFAHPIFASDAELTHQATDSVFFSHPETWVGLGCEAKMESSLKVQGQIETWLLKWGQDAKKRRQQ